MKAEDVPRSARDNCRSCKTPVIWVTTEAGHEMMVDLEPGGYQTTDKNGQPKYVSANLALTVVGNVVKVRVVKPHLAFGNRNLHLSHFVRCPHSKVWRRPTASPTKRRAGSR